MIKRPRGSAADYMAALPKDKAPAKRRSPQSRNSRRHRAGARYRSQEGRLSIGTRSASAKHQSFHLNFDLWVNWAPAAFSYKLGCVAILILAPA